MPSKDDLTGNKQLEQAHDPLQNWLHSVGSQGALESEGDFSIAQDKAWEKLGAFQLPFTGAWVLKLVQAAVAGEATSIDRVPICFNRRTRRRMAFAMRLSAALYWRGSVLPDLLTPEQTPSRGRSRQTRSSHYHIASRLDGLKWLPRRLVTLIPLNTASQRSSAV